MTLGRVYVPPNRQTTNQFLANRMPQSNESYSNSLYNNNNNVITNGHSEAKKVTNGFKTIEIQVHKKEGRGPKKIDQKGKH